MLFDDSLINMIQAKWKVNYVEWFRETLSTYVILESTLQHCYAKLKPILT